MANITSNVIHQVYMVVPVPYVFVYKRLLNYLVDFGLDLLKDCDASCSSSNKKIMDCWNLFQSACAAYNIYLITEDEDEQQKYLKKATIIINYINAQLDIIYSEKQISDDDNQLRFVISEDGSLMASIIKDENNLPKVSFDEEVANLYIEYAEANGIRLKIIDNQLVYDLTPEII